MSRYDIDTESAPDYEVSMMGLGRNNRRTLDNINEGNTNRTRNQLHGARIDAR